MLEAGPRIISSIMGIYPETFVAQMKARGISWWATATTVAEARAAVAAGAEVIVAQGAEAGGHRGAFDPAEAERRQVGLFALLPAIVNAVDLPVVATGGYCRRARRRSSTRARCQRGTNRHRFFALPRGENRSSLG
jgi:nitronate monooxygenase